MKPLALRNLVIDARHGALLCAPLTARDESGLATELTELARSPAQLLEWRMDFFDGLNDPARCLEAARLIRTQAPEQAIILTRRSQREGGEAITLNEHEVLERYRLIARAGLVDVLDWELSSPGDCFAGARALAHQTGTLLLASCHDFSGTPPLEAMMARLTEAAMRGADLAKLAVMPHSRQDVLTLLQATLNADETLDIPVVTMAMGALGAGARAYGWQYGSALTFGAGLRASAPGQPPLEKLARLLDDLRHTSAP